MPAGRACTVGAGTLTVMATTVASAQPRGKPDAEDGERQREDCPVQGGRAHVELPVGSMGEGNAPEKAYAAAFVLLMIVVGLNLAVNWIAKRGQHKWV